MSYRCLFIVMVIIENKFSRLFELTVLTFFDLAPRTIQSDDASNKGRVVVNDCGVYSRVYCQLM